ncbi:MAG TPA: DegT/DnrJ/EryC1/StrS family aminotransferase [Rubricoccaceae bacterium]|jgi:dTDP-4-amino-4,6-dideoxygalactose transaminase
MSDLQIPLFELDIEDAEVEAVTAVLRSRWLTMGDQIAAFEREFAERHRVAHAFAVNNCTAGLQLAYRAVGVSPGDEVIVPALTFVATANAAIALGATPVFADVTSEDDFSVSPASVERLITSKTRAIAAVHYAGYAVDLGALRQIADAHGLSLIEDCAHAPGASHGGRPVGAVGEVGCFSFFSNKNLSTGEGGMVTTDDPELAARLRLLRSHGMTTLTLDRHRGHAFSYDVVEAGYNFRMDEMHAALGRVQLAKLDRKNEQRRAIVRQYRARLAAVPGLAVPYAAAPLGEASAHILPVILPEGTDREAVMAAMRQAGVQTSVHYPPVHQFKAYAGKVRSDAALTERLAPRLLTLPLYPSMTPENVKTVCEALHQAIDRTVRESRAAVLA